MTVDLQGHVFNQVGDAVNGANVAIFTVATNATESTSDSSATATTTTDGTGLWTANNVATGTYDVRISYGSEFRWLRGEDRIQLDKIMLVHKMVQLPLD